VRGFGRTVIVNCFANPAEQEFMVFDPDAKAWSPRIRGEAPILFGMNWLVTFDAEHADIVVRGRGLQEIWRRACEFPGGDWLEARVIATVGPGVLVVRPDRSGLRFLSMLDGSPVALDGGRATSRPSRGPSASSSSFAVVPFEGAASVTAFAQTVPLSKLTDETSDKRRTAR
jgi:hypothetical protein